ncbi:MAG: hypothetical protein RIS70_4238, partial [Planctomycetota bacterium]
SSASSMAATCWLLPYSLFSLDNRIASLIAIRMVSRRPLALSPVPMVDVSANTATGELLWIVLP